MPASEVQKLYREHKLHSGKGGPIVKSKKQATAIQISMARREGHDIPEVKGSFQAGGLVPEGGAYQVHRGEEVLPPPPDIGLQPPGMPPDLAGPQKGPAPPAQKPSEAGRKNPWLAEMRANVNAPLHTVQGFQHGGLVPDTGIYQLHAGETVVPNEAEQRRQQAQDIAARTRTAEDQGWRTAMAQRGSPLDMFGAGSTGPTNPRYAVEGLQGNVAQRMREQAAAANRGTTSLVPDTFLPGQEQAASPRNFRRR